MIRRPNQPAPVLPKQEIINHQNENDRWGQENGYGYHAETGGAIPEGASEIFFFYDTILAGREREALLAVANDLLDVLRNASCEAPMRGLTLENTFNPSHMIGGLVGAAIGFFVGFFLGFPLLFLFGKKFFLLIPVLALGGAALGYCFSFAAEEPGGVKAVKAGAPAASGGGAGGRGDQGLQAARRKAQG